MSRGWKVAVTLVLATRYASGASPILLAPQRKVSVIGDAIDKDVGFAAMYVGRAKAKGFFEVRDTTATRMPCRPVY